MQNAEKLADWGYRAVHETAASSKALINAFYGEAPKFSYFTGCSAGGRQAMKEAQRYPADFDGIIAGSPGLDWTGRAVGAVRLHQLFEKSAEHRVPTAKFAAINAAVLQKCDGLDGVADGVLENPKACSFDPAVLQCKAGATPDNSCLTAAELETVRAMYTSPVNPKSKREITGLVPGSELNWTELGWSGPARSTGLEPFTLTADERRDLIAFLESLTDREALRDPRWSDPWK